MSIQNQHDERHKWGRRGDEETERMNEWRTGGVDGDSDGDNDGRKNRDTTIRKLMRIKSAHRTYLQSSVSFQYWQKVKW